MRLALPMLFASVLPAPDLSFPDARLGAWQGHGFSATAATGAGPGRTLGVSSGDRGRAGRKALLYQTFVVPPGVAVIRFTGAALRAGGCEPGPALDIILEAAEREMIPKRVQTADGPREVGRLLPPENGRPREYFWPVSGRAGETLRIALIDDDDRPGCHVYCGGFRLVAADDYNGRAFADDMRRLQRKERLPPMTRLDSEHFTAIGDAGDDALERRLDDGETIYALFFDHFRRKGFAVRPPDGRMMMAVFDSQEGFEAYLGRRMPSANTGVYDRETNRLVVYDYAGNRAFAADKRRGDEIARTISSPLERGRFVAAFGRRAREIRDDADVGTAMHEIAHQLSFNGGMLERDGDVPAWLAEGLACYCESTAAGGWRGVGEPNPMRAASLAAPAHGGGLIALKDMVRGDDWLRGATAGQAILWYAESWALFRLLMEERPAQLRRYLELIRGRRTPDRRLDDFAEAFGSFSKLEGRYRDYVREVAGREAPTR